MKLYIKQKVFSWRDRFSVYDDHCEPRYNVEGELFTWGRKLHVYDTSGEERSFIQQKMWSWLPKYEIYIGGRLAARVVREFTFFKPRYAIEGPGWSVEGDFWEHDYTVSGGNMPIVSIQKEWLTWGDCYTLDVFDPQDEVLALSVVLAIDAVTADSGAGAATSAST